MRPTLVAVAAWVAAAQDCRSNGASYRNVKVWQLRVPSSGSSTFVHALRSFPPAPAVGDCVPHARCERRPVGGSAAACDARLRFAALAGYNPGHRHFGGFAPSVGTNRAALAATTIRHPALWVASTRKHWRSHEANWFAWAEGAADAASYEAAPLEDYVRRAFWSWNTFTRALAGNFTGNYVSGLFHNPPGARTTPAELRRAARARNGDESLLRTAVANLEAMPFFVLVERYDASVALLRHATCLRASYATRARPGRQGRVRGAARRRLRGARAV